MFCFVFFKEKSVLSVNAEKSAFLAADYLLFRGHNATCAGIVRQL